MLPLTYYVCREMLLHVEARLASRCTSYINLYSVRSSQLRLGLEPRRTYAHSQQPVYRQSIPKTTKQMVCGALRLLIEDEMMSRAAPGKAAGVRR